ncbi:hypothetical protein FKM82_010799 [Ascaphus truei]
MDYNSYINIFFTINAWLFTAPFGNSSLSVQQYQHCILFDVRICFQHGVQKCDFNLCPHYFARDRHLLRLKIEEIDYRAALKKKCLFPFIINE